MDYREKENCIPENTIFCDGCSYYFNRGLVKTSRESGCEHASYCQSDCHKAKKVPCTQYECGCNYLEVMDKAGETSLVDGVKICGVSTGM